MDKYLGARCIGAVATAPAGIDSLQQSGMASGAQLNHRALDAKRLATATARAALAGIFLTVIDADYGGAEFIATDDAVTFRFNDLAEVETWLDRPVEFAR